VTSEQNSAIHVDPGTGLKTFNTRAAKASEKIAGKGYSVVEDEGLKVLPPHPPGAVFNAEEQAKYRAFKEARRGAADYMAMEGVRQYSRMLSTEPVPRARSPRRSSSSAGLCRAAACTSSAKRVHRRRFCEKATSSTWYWNCYGYNVTSSRSYLPLLEEMEYVPTVSSPRASRSRVL
jgi:hypothetical protein